MRVVLIVFISTVCCSSFAQKKEDVKNAQALYGFIENKGQILDQDNLPFQAVKYLLHLPNNNVSLRQTGFSYDTYSTEGEISSPNSSAFGDGIINYNYHRVDVEFEGANPDVEMIASERSTDYLYYYNEAEAGTKVYHYGKVLYRNIYPGIDLEFISRSGSSKPIEYNFIVRPGSDVSLIRLRYNGANAARLLGGKLLFSLDHGNLTESIPESYWQSSKEKVEIKYCLLAKHGSDIAIGFSGKVAKKDEALIIDPTPTLDWGTYYGGTGEDVGTGVVLDASGNIYITGYTTSNSIATTGAHQVSINGNSDAFITKFNASGQRLWATYYGGSGIDEAKDIAIDESGNIAITGDTNSPNVIASAGAHQQVHTGSNFADGFIVKFNSNGVRQWGTYYGGDRTDRSFGITFDSGGNSYIVGMTESSSGISSSGAHQTVFMGESNGASDGFIAKFSPSGLRLWGTYYGGTVDDEFKGVAIDSENNVHIVGRTSSINLISTANVHQPSHGGGSDSDLFSLNSTDGLIVKFNSSGTRLWGTYYGGALRDELDKIRIDDENKLYVYGLSASPGMASALSYQTTMAGMEDAILIKFDVNGTRQWGTYYGGTNYEYPDPGGFTVTGSGDIYIGGSTMSTSQIATNDAYQTIFKGGGDAYLARFNSSGVIQWGTYYGGLSHEGIFSIDHDLSDHIYVSGVTVSNTLITTPGSYQPSKGGGLNDAFLSKFSTLTVSPCTAPEIVGLAIQNSLNICAIKFSTANLPNCTATYLWDFGDGQTSGLQNPVHVYGSAGTYNVSLQISYSCPSCENEATLTKQVAYSPPTDILENRTITVVSDQRLEVISTSVSSFTDTWPLNHTTEALNNKGGYVNGSQGVWRNNASYVYKEDRSASASPNISKDGTFTMNQFNWKYAEFNVVPKWIQANTMTRYSPYSFELENRDVLGVYSGAIYDYGGQLPAANGVNMRQDEMAFTSFEFIDGSVAGNWILSSQTVSNYTTFPIISAGKHLAIVDATVAQLQNVVAVDVIAERSQSALAQNPLTHYQPNEIICTVEHPDNPLWAIIVLKTTPIEDYWVGILRIKNVVTPTVVSVRDNTIAHTGKQSLKVTTNQTFRQDLLHLDAGKSYWVNCWVSVNNPYVTTPVLATGLGIDVIARQKNGVVIATFPFTPSGTVIEGWQQLKGSFNCPANTAYVEVQFKPGSTGTAWYDDLRLQPENGNMKGYVYNLNDYRLEAVLDEENFASYFYYDREGNLHLTKKETTDGIKTLSENVSYQVER